MNGQEYAAEHGVTFDWSSHGYQRDESGWEHQRFTVTLAVDDRSESFEWRQGLRVGTEPEVGQVLEALVSDAHAGAESFEDFCADFGYDTDSRKAYATWLACQATARQLENLLGEVPDVEDES